MLPACPPEEPEPEPLEDDDPPDEPPDDPPEFEEVCCFLPEPDCVLPDPLWPLSAEVPPLLPEFDVPLDPQAFPPDEPDDAEEEPLPELPDSPLDGFSGSFPFESLVG